MGEREGAGFKAGRDQRSRRRGIGIRPQEATGSEDGFRARTRAWTQRAQHQVVRSSQAHLDGP